MIIILLGYMGSGKSTIGKELATILNFSFLDLDDYISDKEKASIPDLFESKGEIYFRKKEAEYLSEVLNTSDHMVLALGGGTPCYSNNMDVLENNAKVVTIYLKLSIEQLSQRLCKEREKRPLISRLKTKAELAEFIGKHLFERSAFYNKAKYVLKADHKSKEEILKELVAYLV